MRAYALGRIQVKRARAVDYLGESESRPVLPAKLAREPMDEVGDYGCVLILASYLGVHAHIERRHSLRPRRQGRENRPSLVDGIPRDKHGTLKVATPAASPAAHATNCLLEIAEDSCMSLEFRMLHPVDDRHL